ncbi:hypothetical protein NX059_006481 [Plenodomus lindquistii]|nr:hypothetical protein NX059_006481 [Plenodomus lindquistii]
MSTATGSAPPPPPPPSGSDPNKHLPGHNVAGTYPDGDGSSFEKAAWVIGSDRTHSRHWVVHRRTEAIKWVRCNMKEAVMDLETGYDVYDAATRRKVSFKYKGGRGPRLYEAFAEQMWEVVAEEWARVERHEDVGGEDLAEDADEEYENSGDRIFDVGFTRSSPISSGLYSSRNSPNGHLSSPVAGPRTPFRQEQTSLSPAGQRSGGSRGRGSGGSLSSPTGRSSERLPFTADGHESFGSPNSRRGKSSGAGSSGAGSASKYGQRKRLETGTGPWCDLESVCGQTPIDEDASTLQIVSRTEHAM